MVILQSHINQFLSQFELSHSDKEKQFEHFVNYAVASNCIKNISITNDILDDMSVGDGGDWGLDGILITINGKPMTTLEQVRQFFVEYTPINVKIVLMQAKTQTTIDSGDMHKVLDGVENLLLYALGEPREYPPCNESVKEYRDILKEIYMHSADFGRDKFPSMHLYFAYQGEYQSPVDIVTLIANRSSTILKHKCLSDFSCKVLDRRSIVDYYKAGQEKNVVELSFDQKLPLPIVPKMDSGYLCLIPMSEFKKMIIDDEGNFREEVFYDNVRAFQGHNYVKIDKLAKLRPGR